MRYQFVVSEWPFRYSVQCNKHIPRIQIVHLMSDTNDSVYWFFSNRGDFSLCFGVGTCLSRSPETEIFSNFVEALKQIYKKYMIIPKLLRVFFQNNQNVLAMNAYWIQIRGVSISPVHC